LRRNRSPSPVRVSATDCEDPTLVGAVNGVRVENRSIKTTAARAIVMEDHFSRLRAVTGSGASAIAESWRIAIERSCSRGTMILWLIFPTAEVSYRPLAGAA